MKSTDILLKENDVCRSVEYMIEEKRRINEKLKKFKIDTSDDDDCRMFLYLNNRLKTLDWVLTYVLEIPEELYLDKNDKINIEITK